MHSSARVKVALRIRPLSPREVSAGHRCILQPLDENGVVIWDPTSYDALNGAQNTYNIDPSCWSRNFHFDYCLWSMDRNSSTYASQEDVFQTIGQSVVHHTIEGFNTCVLAYGQTGAGKTWSMLGSGDANPEEYGLIPRICYGLFDAFEAIAVQQNALGGSVEATGTTVDFSYLEIYNETLRDCLKPNNKATMRVREHPSEGTYVSHLTTVRVGAFEDILSLIAIGNKSRSIAATRTNARSSRSHAIVTLTVRQRFRDMDHKEDGLLTSTLRQKHSRVHLVDLAGSERVTYSGAVGMRLREANNINKSLSVLGDVIKCLGDQRSKPQQGFIPYRNSALTMVLKDSLGGNAHTVMMAMVSPSSMDYDETLSTLKYADNAKRVRNRVNVNVTSGLMATDNNAVMLVPVLQAEVNKLRALLQEQQSRSSVELNPSFGVVQEMQARVRELEEQLAEREALIQSLEITRHELYMQQRMASRDEGVGVDASWESNNGVSSSLSRTAAVRRNKQPVILLDSDDVIDTSLPRVINLNQDPLFSECLVYYIPDGMMMAGSADSEVDILLSAPDILPQHAIFYNRCDEITISPCKHAKVYVNGQMLKFGVKTSVYHHDRIAMGRHHLFRFEGKNQTSTRSNNRHQTTGSQQSPPGWDFAHDELLMNKDLSSRPPPPPPQPASPPSARSSSENTHPIEVFSTALSRNTETEEIFVNSTAKKQTDTMETNGLHYHEPIKQEQTAVVPPTNHIGTSPTSTRRLPTPDIFEKEALALQQDLAMMQKNLQERMNKYRGVLNTYKEGSQSLE